MMRRIALIAAALAAALAGAGCKTVNPAAATTLGESAGVGEFTYVAGRATQSFSSPPSTVQTAVLAALEDLRIVNVQQTREGPSVLIQGTTADKRGASVTIHPQPGGTTRLTARLGLFGDEPLSRALMDRVGIRLGALPPSPIVSEAPSSPGSNPYFSRSAVPDSEMFKDQAEARTRGADTP